MNDAEFLGGFNKWLMQRGIGCQEEHERIAAIVRRLATNDRPISPEALSERPENLPPNCQWIPRSNEEPRIETGPIAFGNDWPGVFIRGDNAGWYAFLLGRLLDGNGDALGMMQLRGLLDDLSGCIIGPARDIVRPKKD